MGFYKEFTEELQELVIGLKPKVFNEGKAHWQATFNAGLSTKKFADFSALNEELITVREANLNSRSKVIHLASGQAVRVYNPTRTANISYEVSDVFARGIDSARAACEILRHSSAAGSTARMNKAMEKNSATQDKLVTQPQKLTRLTRSIAVFHNKMQEYSKQEEQAKNDEVNATAKEKQVQTRVAQAKTPKELANAKAQLKAVKEEKAQAVKAKAKTMKLAIAESKRYNAVLAALLVEENVVAKTAQANKALHFVRDFLWKKDICMPFCGIEQKIDEHDNAKSYQLRYAEPIRFKNPQFKDKNLAGNTPLNYWSDEQAWLGKLTKSVGSSEEHPWFTNFRTQHQTDLDELSSTAMSRATPNPANAFRTIDAQFDSEKNLIATHHTFKIAATEPLDVGNTKSMQDLTDYNHLQFIAGKQLEENLNLFMERWGSLFADTEEPIPFTLLHQTLIADEVSFSPDQLKAKANRLQSSIIDSKISANNAMQEMISNHVILRNKNDGTIQWIPKTLYNYLKTSAAPDDTDKWQDYQTNYQIVNVNLLQTNDSINMWYVRSRIRNNDVTDARQLIANGVSLYEEVEGLNEKEQRNLATIIQFLKSSNYSLLRPSKFKSQAVTTALSELTASLRERDTPLNIDANNLALSLNAAVELKCTINETYLGAARRNLTNFSRNYFRLFPVLGTAIDWAGRGILGLVALVAKVPFLPLILVNWWRYGSHRKVVFKAAYEGILADTIGNVTGGCMSALDRAGEMSEQRAAMLQQFCDEGKLISYNDLAAEKERFYSTYSSTKYKHDYAEMATGTPGTSDKETEGFFANEGLMCARETAEEKALSKMAGKLRKGHPDSNNLEEYLTDDADAPALQESSIGKEEEEEEEESVQASTKIQSAQNSVVDVDVIEGDVEEERKQEMANPK